jgi:iron complex transport system ATP-binding protein
MTIAVRNLSYSFGEKKVLRDVSFDVGEGEFIGLMGPNGSGKTTLLRCMMNFLPAPEGSVSVGGLQVQSLSPIELAKTFAVVPQSSSTDFIFSAYDIVMMGRLPHRKSSFSGPTRDDAAAVKSAMERTNTWKFAARPFFALSGGERQRVVVARAIAQHPKALLLDEPTVFLDISGQLEIMDLIKSLNREGGMTVVAVLHDVNLAARYCDRIALLSGGRLEAIGPPAEVLNPGMLQSVYGVDVIVRRDPFTNSVYVVPHSMAVAATRHGTRIHMICGGGTGGHVMKSLVDLGYSVSTGVLNVLDSDFENANDLHIATIAEVPFAPISEPAHGENLRLIGESSAVVVTPFPVGPGNMKNLEAAVFAALSGKPVFLIERDSRVNIDFVGGKADASIKELVNSGAVLVKDLKELLSRLSHGESG